MALDVHTDFSMVVPLYLWGPPLDLRQGAHLHMWQRHFFCVISSELLSACDGGTSPVLVGGFSVILAIGSSRVASKDLVAPL